MNRDAASRRRDRLDDMRKWLLKPGRLPLLRRQVEALLEVRYGLTRSTVRDYLQTFIDLGTIEIVDDMVVLGPAQITLKTNL